MTGEADGMNQAVDVIFNEEMVGGRER